MNDEMAERFRVDPQFRSEIRQQEKRARDERQPIDRDEAVRRALGREEEAKKRNNEKPEPAVPAPEIPVVDWSPINKEPYPFSPGLTFKTISSTSTSPLMSPQMSSGSGGEAMPNDTVLRPFTIHTSGTKVGVEPASNLYVGITWSTQAISTLLTDRTNPNDAGWTTATNGVCYIKGTLDSTGAITACEIKWGGDLAALQRTTIEPASGSTPAFQKEFVFPLGKITVSGSNIAVEQWADRHLTLMDLNINGYLCRYPLAVF